MVKNSKWKQIKFWIYVKINNDCKKFSIVLSSLNISCIFTKFLSGFSRNCLLLELILCIFFSLKDCIIFQDFNNNFEFPWQFIRFLKGFSFKLLQTLWWFSFVFLVKCSISSLCWNFAVATRFPFSVQKFSSAAYNLIWIYLHHRNLLIMSSQLKFNPRNFKNSHSLQNFSKNS